MFFEHPILAIETSCDETSAAVVVGNRIFSNVIASQIEMHRKWGGIVPEAAARAHVESILPVIEEALGQGEVGLNYLKAIAVTNRPGLVGALSVGVTAAKALSFSLGIPLLGVHHLEGHLLSPFAEHNVPFPHIALIVSGGHTEIVRVSSFGEYEIIGETRDDAAGEAFDKASRLLGLGYPGGPAIQEAAKSGKSKYPLPVGLKGDTFDFSFSGFKTAVLRLTEREGDSLNIADAAASVQDTVTRVLTERSIRAAEAVGAQALTLVGGVAANRMLRERMMAACEKIDLPFFTPSIKLCTDNAGMIGIAASTRLARGEASGIDLDVISSAELGS